MTCDSFPESMLRIADFDLTSSTVTLHKNINMQTIQYLPKVNNTIVMTENKCSRDEYQIKPIRFTFGDGQMSARLDDECVLCGSSCANWPSANCELAWQQNNNSYYIRGTSDRECKPDPCYNTNIHTYIHIHNLPRTMD